jgi:hypothetical protein
MPQDGTLDQKEYDAYCKATEAGAGCDDERWAAHKKTLGAEAEGALSLRNFCRLYSDEKMLKHYGHEQRDLDFARAKLVKATEEKDKAQLVRSCPTSPLFMSEPKNSPGSIGATTPALLLLGPPPHSLAPCCLACAFFVLYSSQISRRPKQRRRRRRPPDLFRQQQRPQRRARGRTRTTPSRRRRRRRSVRPCHCERCQWTNV